jgi:hypothetical protein
MTLLHVVGDRRRRKADQCRNDTDCGATRRAKA